LIFNFNIYTSYSDNETIDINVHRALSLAPMFAFVWSLYFVRGRGGNQSTQKKTHLSDLPTTWPPRMPNTGTEYRTQRRVECE